MSGESRASVIAKATGTQQITRIPPWRPGRWVRVRTDPSAGDLSGRVVRVKSLTCSITHPQQRTAQWRVHFEDGRCLLAALMLREASEAEVQAVLARRGETP